MASKYCSKCGTQVMVAIRICPQCGDRTFSSNSNSQTSLNRTNGGNVVSASTSFTAVGVVSQRAGYFKRASAYIADSLIITVISLSVAAIISSTGIVAQEGRLGLNGFFGLRLLVAIFTSITYYTFMLASNKGATWGFRLFGLRIVTVNNSPLTLGLSFSRALLTTFGQAVLLGLSIAYIIEVGSEANILAALLPMYIPFLMVFFNDKRQTLYDLICKTCVVIA